MVAWGGKELGRGAYRLGKRAYRFPEVRGLAAHDFLGESVCGLTAHDFLGLLGAPTFHTRVGGLSALLCVGFLCSGVLDCEGIIHSV